MTNRFYTQCLAAFIVGEAIMLLAWDGLKAIGVIR